MLVFKTLIELKDCLNELRLGKKTIGLIPTMGALHDGHISLINYSKKVCDYTVCSIFINPTQFTNAEDLERYPRTPEKDIELLEKAGCNFLYMPQVEDIYPKNFSRTFDFGYLDSILEGASRPGHFNGVGQVVSILLEGIKPDKAFFGSKDYQQVMVVKSLVKQLSLPIEIVSCPILRESDGLAMSSRNKLLSDKERITASQVPLLMSHANKIIKAKGIKEAKRYVEETVSKIQHMTLDYFEVCNAHTLEKLEFYPATSPAISLIAVFVGKVRLIDNLQL